MDNSWTDYLKYTKPSANADEATAQIGAAKTLRDATLPATGHTTSTSSTTTSTTATTTTLPPETTTTTLPPEPGTQVSGIAVSGLEFAENTLPGTAGQTYPNYPASTYTNLSNKGFGCFRIPFLSDRLFGLTGTDFVSAYRTILDKQIEQATKPVWLDPHNYGRKNKKNEPLGSANYPVQLFVDRLTKLAITYKDNPKVECIELDNEPHSLANKELWYSACKQAVDSMRAAGWTKLIGIPIYHWSSMDDFFGQHGANFTPPIVGDSKIHYIFHNYFNAGNTGYNHPSEPNEAASLHVERLQNVIDWANDKNVKLAITEFGVPAKQSWVDNMKPFVNTMKANKNIVTHYFYWASGDWYNSDTVLKDIHLTALF